MCEVVAVHCVGDKRAAIFPLILGGGLGKRLWPISNQSVPKQFLKLWGCKADSLMQKTLRRVNRLFFHPPVISSNAKYISLLREQINEIECMPSRIILEPYPRNTAAAICVASLYIDSLESEAYVLSMPIDHYIEDERRFCTIVEEAYVLMKKSTMSPEIMLTLFGVKPETITHEYGYLQQGYSIEGQMSQIADFVEKPDSKHRVMRLYEERMRDLYWNSGIYVYKNSALLWAFKEYLPHIYDVCCAALNFAKYSKGEDIYLCKYMWSSVPAVSIEYALLEKQELRSRLAMVPLEVGWSDIGIWSNLYRVIQRIRYSTTEHIYST